MNELQKELKNLSFEDLLKRAYTNESLIRNASDETDEEQMKACVFDLEFCTEEISNRMSQVQEAALEDLYG